MSRQRQPIPPKATFEGSPFERFAKTVRALIGVPKKDLDELLKQEEAEKREKRHVSNK